MPLGILLEQLSPLFNTIHKPFNTSLNSHFQITPRTTTKMPLWIIYHPPSVFTEAKTKAAFAKAVTHLYSVGGAGLPAFYVNVFFQSIQPDSLYIGGVSRPSPNKEADKPGSENSVPFVRVTIEHLARQLYVYARMLNLPRHFSSFPHYETGWSFHETNRRADRTPKYATNSCVVLMR